MASSAKPSSFGDHLDIIAEQLDHTTIVSLLSVLTILQVAYILSVKLLPRASTTSTKVLFVWHAFDSLIHFIFEGSFLYNCLFTSTSLSAFSSANTHPASLVSSLTPNAHGVISGHWLNQPSKIFGARAGENWGTSLWMVYAQADKRWAGTDTTVVSLELLTVLIGGPLAAWVCYGLVKGRKDTSFWIALLATGELYGGFMTFCPEWLTGSPNLDTSNFMFLWVYLVFFNVLWVFLPIYALYVVYWDLRKAVEVRDQVLKRNVAKKAN